MIWKEFIDAEIRKLIEKKKKDPQYSKLSLEDLKKLFLREIARWLEFKRGVRFEEFLILQKETINKAEKNLISRFILKRLSGLPLAYILGEVDFSNLKIKVNKHTLIPRPETEELADLVTDYIRQYSKPIDLIEIGTGSGCLGLSIIKKINKKASVCLVDISKPALRIAKLNSEINKIDSQNLKFIQSNLLNFLKQEKSIIDSKKRLIIAANLPYISEKEYQSLSLEVKNNEPKKALAGGKKGSELINKLIDQVFELIIKKNPKKEISIFIEASPTTIPDIKQHIKDKKYPLHTEEIKDCSGKIRFLELNTKY